MWTSFNLLFLTKQNLSSTAPYKVHNMLLRYINTIKHHHKNINTVENNILHHGNGQNYITRFSHLPRHRKMHYENLYILNCAAKYDFSESTVCPPESVSVDRNRKSSCVPVWLPSSLGFSSQLRLSSPLNGYSYSLQCLTLHSVLIHNVTIYNGLSLIKKKRKLSSYIRKFRRDRVQSHIWLTAPHIWLNICNFLIY